MLELVKKIVKDSGLDTAFSGDDDESVNKKANIEEFVNSVADFERLNGNADLSEYLQQVSLVSDTDEMDETEYVTLATVHAVKGLEFKCVFVVGLEENILPSSRAETDEDALEEERRIMYVAVTRAKERLYLTRSKSRFLYGKRESTARSRFTERTRRRGGTPQRYPHGKSRSLRIEIHLRRLRKIVRFGLRRRVRKCIRRQFLRRGQPRRNFGVCRRNARFRARLEKHVQARFGRRRFRRNVRPGKQKQKRGRRHVHIRRRRLAE